MRILASAFHLALAALVAGTAARAEAQSAGEPFSHAPRQEVPGRQIGWYVNRTLDAFTAAVESNKALIVVFGDATSSVTRNFADRVVPCPHLNQLAGAAVFAYGSPKVDEMAHRMAAHLKLTDYPTISIIAPRTDRLTEVYRLEGFFDAASAEKYLYQALVANRLWPASARGPERLTTDIAAYPGLACTWDGAKRIGLAKPYDPPP